MSQPGQPGQPGHYPNVYVRLRLSRRQPAVPDRDSEVDIWLRGTRFHVRDHASRRATEILEDVTAPRGLGRPVRTIEEAMDVGTVDEMRKGARPTELYGDIASDEGWVYPPEEPRWAMAASELAPAAAQILATGKEVGLQAVGPTTRAGRAATEYRGTVEVTEDGMRLRNIVTRVIAPPYLLLEEARDSEIAALSYTRSIVTIQEGAVTEADVTPPRK